MSDTTERMQECARSLQVILPPGTGFFIMAFDFEQAPGTSRCDYVSNARRQDVVKLMEEFIRKAGDETKWMRHLE